MTTIVHDTIAAELAELTREVSTPAGDLGYGVDLHCVDDLREDMAEVDPFSVLGVGQAIVRRLTTPRGSVPDAPDYGIDLRAYCNRGVPESEIQGLAARVRSEVTKDDRVRAATVTVTANASTGALTVSIVVTPAIVALASFTLTFAVTSGAVLLESIG